MSGRPLPVTLRRSEAYADSPAGATELWTEGYRPMRARRLREGMVVAYRETDMLTGRGGPLRYARVLEIEDNGEVTLNVRHSGGEAEVYEDDEVWARRPARCPQVAYRPEAGS